MADWTTCRVTPEMQAELRRAALIEGHDAAHYPTSVVVPTRTLLALLDAAAERDALAAKVERVRALHFGEYVEDEDQNRCFECGDDWPCPTIRAITDPDTDGTQRSPR